ncbi:protein ABC transporter 1, mitochondrial [Tanacetum coccineum]|uniref:Protein ABC transporter 1, mitochondrial n=1 Tax=Tanacetum coccineum TaxID=301880 RepID=A0ABQ5D8U5_9ASTR
MKFGVNQFPKCTTTRLTATSNNDDGVNERLRSVEETLATITQTMQEMIVMNKGINGNGRNQNQHQFSGDDVKGWLFRCEQFFSIDEIPDSQKVKLIYVHLFDNGLLWHKQFIRLNGENVSQNVYKFGILQRFSTVYDDPVSEIRKVKYQTNAKEYKDAFDTLLSRVDHHGMWSKDNSKPPLLGLPTPNTNWKSKPNNPVNTPVRKQLIQKEYQEKRAQNFVFYYDNQKYTPGHKCSGQLYSLVVLAYEEDEYFKVEEGDEVMPAQEELP